MISILIPTYNAVCLSLIEKMYKQAIALRIPVSYTHLTLPTTPYV